MLIDNGLLPKVTRTRFAAERPEIFEAYSDFEREPEVLTSSAQIEERLLARSRDGQSFFDFAIWYPSCGGRVEKDRSLLAARGLYPGEGAAAVEAMGAQDEWPAASFRGRRKLRRSRRPGVALEGEGGKSGTQAGDSQSMGER